MEGVDGIMFLIGGALGAALGLAIGLDVSAAAAVKAGVAFYSINPETGETKFQYRTPAVAP